MVKLCFAMLVASCLFAESSVAVRNGNLFVLTDEIDMSFEGFNVRSLRNTLTGEIYVSKPGPGWMDLSLQDPTSEFLRPGTWQLNTDPDTGLPAASIVATDSVRKVTLTVGVASGGKEVFFRLEASANRTGVRGLLWGMQGFDPAGRFVLPGQAGIYFDSRSPRSRLALEYPTHWEAQFAVYEAAKGSLLVYAQDPKPVFKRVQTSRELGTLDIGLEVFATAPWPAASNIPVIEWRLKAVAGNWRKAADEYRRWSDNVWAQRVITPGLEWVRTIQSVIVVVDAQDNYLTLLAEKLNPKKTLLYLVNWRKDSYDVNYPDYTPASGTADFVRKAKAMGFRTMLHSSALGVAQYHPAYQDLKKYQLRNPEDEQLIFWPFGLWPGGSPPPEYLPSFAFISPAASAYRKMYLEAVAPAIETVQPDALHLDAGGVLLNDSNGSIEGLNSIEGMVQLHKDLAARFPDLAFSYESMTEPVAGLQQLAQRWNSDHESHPISTYLMGDRVRFYGFLDQENPDEP
ncbi:MAG: hypothetical protein H7039_10495, partial [Bryobacteraceae bacterium]|nr:hypothetical protein [Bryobacteraceae bacterium]